MAVIRSGCAYSFHVILPQPTDLINIIFVHKDYIQTIFSAMVAILYNYFKLSEDTRSRSSPYQMHGMKVQDGLH